MSNDGYIRIGADISEAMSFFENLDVNKLAIQKALLRAAGQGAKTHVKKTMNHVLANRTGQLKKTITYKVHRLGKTVVITNNAENRGIRYGFVLAAGWTAPKKVDNSRFYEYQAKLAAGLKLRGRAVKFKEQKTGLMTFKIGDKWIRTYHTQGKSRDFVEGPVERYVETAEFHKQIDKALQKQIDYWEKRIKAGKI